MRRLPLPPVTFKHLTVSGDMLPSAMGVRPEPVRLPYPAPSGHPISVHEAACTRRDYPPLCLKQACRFWRIKRSWADSPGRSPWERVMMKRLDSLAKQRPFTFKLPRNRFRAGQPLLFSVLGFMVASPWSQYSVCARCSGVATTLVAAATVTGMPRAFLV